MFQQEVLGRFAKVAASNPERNAFCIREEYHTYGQFRDTVGCIRKLLRTVEGKTDKVGLVANDDLFTYASIFALWMEGLAYVPLHPKQPMERNEDVIAQAGLQVVLDSTYERRFASVVTVKTTQCAGLEPVFDTVEAPEDGLAYILFTSGSTGKPKGVPITRANLATFMRVFLGTGINLDETDRCLQCFDLTFDISVQCYLTPLLHGACVYTVPHDQIKFTYVYGLLDDHEITFGVLAPSMIHHLRPYFEEIFLEKLKFCLLVAEATPVDLLQEWFEHIPNAKVFNFYGPTEATIYCISYEAKRNRPIKEANGMLAIGKPFQGTDVVILDENGDVLPQVTKGFMYVSGDQVTQGYWKNPEKNAEAFRTVKYKGTLQRFYKTGDLCLIDEDGDILYYGRSDYQVKIQGYRIELGEIEFYAREAIGGKNAVAFTFKGQGGGDQIALGLETDTFDEKKLLEFLATKLPAYMLPSKIFNVEKFPLNTSDKVDRRTLATLLPL